MRETPTAAKPTPTARPETGATNASPVEKPDAQEIIASVMESELGSEIAKRLEGSDKFEQDVKKALRAIYAKLIEIETAVKKIKSG